MSYLSFYIVDQRRFYLFTIFLSNNRNKIVDNVFDYKFQIRVFVILLSFLHAKNVLFLTLSQWLVNFEYIKSKTCCEEKNCVLTTRKVKIKSNIEVFIEAVLKQKMSNYRLLLYKYIDFFR